MSETADQKKSGPPTAKMIEAAKKAADRHAVKLPTSFDKDFDVCKAFLDEYINKPTAKALALGERIAKDKGVQLPDEVRKNAKQLSEWIDANKG